MSYTEVDTGEPRWNWGEMLRFYLVGVMFIVLIVGLFIILGRLFLQ